MDQNSGMVAKARRRNRSNLEKKTFFKKTNKICGRINILNEESPASAPPRSPPKKHYPSQTTVLENMTCYVTKDDGTQSEQNQANRQAN